MLIDWILALSPILVILVLMIFFRWGAAKAGPAGWFTAVLVAVLRFGAGIELLALSQMKAVLLTMDVLLIVWAAFLLYQVADEAGAVSALSRALPLLTPDRGMQALLIAWAFASFLQGVGGFGVPTAVTAPLMLGLGFSPVVAVVAPSIGHSWSVTFGSLASSFQALMAATGLPGDLLAPLSALLLGLVGFVCGFMVVHVCVGGGGIRRLALPVLIMGLSMSGVQYFLATRGFWHLAGFGAGLAGLAVGFLIARWGRRKSENSEAERMDEGQLLLMLSGYMALILITILIQLVEPVRTFLGQVVIEVPFPEIETSLGYVTPAGYGRRIYLLRHGGAILLYASTVAYVVYRWAGLYKDGSFRRILGNTVRRVMSSSLGIAVMVSMAVVMAHAGMTDVLAKGLAVGVGTYFPVISPWIGALGAFMTGSNTNSNVVFSVLQMRTAELLAISVSLILASQTTGGAVGSVIAPTKIIVGASTAGMAGREGEILKKLLLYLIPLLIALSLLVWGLVEVIG
ncbi:MAG: L-lactate permease [Anaerolineales bacterium]|nr:L-lactate permease [Anaerolineales bacterium]